METRSHLDALPVGVLIHRGGTVTYANEALARVFGWPPAEIVGRPFTDLLAPEDAARVSERYAQRMRGEPVPADYEVTVQGAGGARRVVELTIRVEGEDVLTVVRDVTDRASSNDRRQALARLGAAIQMQSTEAAVRQALRGGLTAVGLSYALLEPAGEGVRIAEIELPGDVIRRFEAATGRRVEGMAGPWSPPVAEAWRKGGAYCDDAPTALTVFVGGPGGPGDPAAAAARALAAAGGMRRVVAVRIDRGGDPYAVLLAHGDWLRHDDLSSMLLLAAQVSVALDNARVIAGTRRRLRNLEAVHGFAERLLAATPGDEQALLAGLCEALDDALGAAATAIYRLDDAGANLRRVAAHGGPFAGASPGESPGEDPLASGGRLAEVLRSQALVLDADGTVLMVPLTSRGTALGVLAVMAGAGAGAGFRDEQVALVRAMASLAAVGLDNAGLYAEARRRVEEISLVHEVGRAVTSTLDLGRVLADGAEALRRLLDASHCFVMLYEPAQRLLRGMVATGELNAGFSEVTIPIDEVSAAAWAVRERKPLVIERADEDPRTRSQLVRRYGEKSLLAVPLVLRDEALGVVIVDECRRVRRFTEAEVERVVLVSHQLAVAVENARLYQNLRRSYADLATAQERLVQRERLAALGELAAVVAHEVRNPLGVIFNSLGALGRMMGTQDPGGEARVLLGIVGEEADRLNQIVSDLLDFARPARPALRPEALDRVLDDAVSAALAGEAGRRVRVERDVPADMAPVVMDARLIRQAVLNLALNAVQAMPGGGTLTVRARLEAGEGGAAMVRIEIGDTGAGLAEGVRERLFEPFFTTKASGTGLGLAVVKRIVDGHAGGVTVASASGAGTTFTIRLPLDDGTPGDEDPRGGDAILAPATSR